MANRFIEWITKTLGRGTNVPRKPDQPAHATPKQPKATVPPPHSKALAQAQKRINALGKKTKLLSLSGLKLPSLPPSIPSLGQLTQLNLSDNMLSDDACKTVAKVEQTHLALSHEKPDWASGCKSIGQLKSLQRLIER